MTHSQILAFAILGCAVVAFATNRFRYDVISLTALLAGIVTGDVAPKAAFTGFTSEVVVVIASALVVSAAVARSGFVEALMRPVVSRIHTPRSQVPVLAGATAVLSMLTKNVSALAILMPTALRLGRSPRSSAAVLLMPMAFLSLLGGLCTLVGTSTNIIVSEVRERGMGKPFAMFDFAPVGLVLTAVGLAFVSFGWRLLPRDRQGRGGLYEVAAATAYLTEAGIGDDWPEQYATVADLDLHDDEIHLVTIEAEGRRQPAAPDSALKPGQVLLLEGSDEALGRVFARLPFRAVRAAHDIDKDEAREELRSVEAVVQPDSPLIGRSAARAHLQARHGIKLLAISRGGTRFHDRLRDVTIRGGDMLVLQAGEKALSEKMRDLDLLPLAERSMRIGNRRQRYLPALITAATIAVVAAQLLPVGAAFFGAAVLMVVTGALSMREAYESLEPEVLVLIGALTPLSEAIQTSGGTTVIAHHLHLLLEGAPPLLVLGTLMVAAMACSPFMHNAPTVLVLGPIGMVLAQDLGLHAEPFLMAVATGSGCDFLTPVGHQCNTLVMGPGGYRFGDYWRLGLPLSILVILLGTPLIAWVWPLTG